MTRLEQLIEARRAGTAKNFHVHGILAAKWIEEQIGFDTKAYRDQLYAIPAGTTVQTIVQELLAMLHAATGMHSQHYAAIYHQVAEAVRSLLHNE